MKDSRPTLPPRSRATLLPRPLLALLRWCLPHERSVEVVGDLEEAGQQHEWSRLRACGCALSIVLSSFVESLRRRLASGRGGWLRSLGDDLGASGRRVLRAPALPLAVAATLALGIGANATMFRVVDRLLLSPPAHVRAPDRVRRILVSRANLRTGARQVETTITYPDYRDFDNAETLAATAGYSDRSMVVGRGEDARRLHTGWASASFFPLLGVEPVLGRFFDATEDRIGAEPTVVLGYGLWRSRFVGAADALGATLYIRGTEFTIVGVAPRGFTGVDLERVDLWLPLHLAAARYDGEGWESSRGWYWLKAVARVQPDAGLEMAAAEATALHRAGRSDQIEQERYDADVEIVFGNLIAARGPRASGASRVATWLYGVTIIVLLIACANVSNLLLSDGLARRRETAVRLALGIARWRLLRLTLLEAAWMTLAGGIGGLAFAYAGGRLLQNTLIPDVAFTHAAISWRVLVVTAITSAVAVALAAAAPALLAVATDPAEELTAGGRNSTRGASRTRQLLTVTQGVLAVVLLVGAGLFVRSLDQVRALDLGFEPEGLAMVQLMLEPRTWDQDERALLLERARAAAEAMPGIESAALTSSIPFAGSWSVAFGVPGLELDKPGSGGPYVYAVTPGYFAAMSMRLTRGRWLTDLDGADNPMVTVVTESMAREIWGSEDPIGQCVTVGGDDAGCTRIVGVVADIRRQAIIERTQWLYYLPLRQGRAHVQLEPAGLVLRTDGELRSVLPSLRRRLVQLAGVEYVDSRPFAALADPQLRSWRLGATMFTVFGALASVVAAIGLYSVLAFAVAQRRRELGIRSALGAAPAQIANLIFRSALGTAALSIGLGLLIAVALAPAWAPLLYEVSPRDPAVLSIVAVGLLSTAAIVATGPALRARRVDPASVLGDE